MYVLHNVHTRVDVYIYKCTDYVYLTYNSQYTNIALRGMYKVPVLSWPG